MSFDFVCSQPSFSIYFILFRRMHNSAIATPDVVFAKHNKQSCNEERMGINVVSVNVRVIGSFATHAFTR